MVPRSLGLHLAFSIHPDLDLTAETVRALLQSTFRYQNTPLLSLLLIFFFTDSFHLLYIYLLESLGAKLTQP